MLMTLRLIKKHMKYSNRVIEWHSFITYIIKLLFTLRRHFKTNPSIKQLKNEKIQSLLFKQHMKNRI